VKAALIRKSPGARREALGSLPPGARISAHSGHQKVPLSCSFGGVAITANALGDFDKFKPVAYDLNHGNLSRSCGFRLG